MAYKVFDKETAGGSVKNKMYKSVMKKIEKRKVHSSFIDNIWGSDLADMQLLSKFNKGIRFLLCDLGIYSKYAWVIPLKDKKGIAITNAFQKILDEWERKPNKSRGDKS